MIALGYRSVSGFLVVILFTSLCSAVCPKSLHQTTFPGYALSPDAKRVAALSADGTLSLWDVATGKRTQLQECINAEFSQHPIRFSPDSNNLAVKAENGVEVFSMATEKVIAELGSPHLRDVINMAFSADGKRLAAIDGEHIALWQIENQSEIAFISEISDRNALALNADGSILAFSARNGIALWDVAKAKVQRTIALPEGTRAESLLFIDKKNLTEDIENHWFAAAIATKQIPKPGDEFQKYSRQAAIWDVTTGKKLRTLEGSFDELSFPLSIGGDTLFATDYEKLHAWNIDTGKRTFTSETLSGRVSGDGRFLLQEDKEMGSLALWLIDNSALKMQTFVYGSPLCAEKSDNPSDVQAAGFDSLAIFDGHVEGGSIGSYAIHTYVAKDCTPVSVAHSRYASEEKATQALQQQMASAAEVLQSLDHDFSSQSTAGKRVVVRFRDSPVRSGGVAIMWTEDKTFYQIYSQSLPVALAMENEILDWKRGPVSSSPKP